MSCIFSHLSQGPWYYASHVSTPNWIKNGLLLGEKWLRRKKKLSWLLPLRNAGPQSWRGQVIVMILENVKISDTNKQFALIDRVFGSNHWETVQSHSTPHLTDKARDVTFIRGHCVVWENEFKLRKFTVMIQRNIYLIYFPLWMA